MINFNSFILNFLHIVWYVFRYGEIAWDVLVAIGSFLFVVLVIFILIYAGIFNKFKNWFWKMFEKIADKYEFNNNSKIYEIEKWDSFLLNRSYFINNKIYLANRKSYKLKTIRLIENSHKSLKRWFKLKAKYEKKVRKKELWKFKK